MTKNQTSFSEPRQIPIITTKEARKVLGKVSKSLSDKDILDVVNALDKIAELLANNTILDKINRDETIKMERKASNETKQ